jgi:hypothetical protein
MAKFFILPIDRARQSQIKAKLFYPDEKETHAEEK